MINQNLDSLRTGTEELSSTFSQLVAGISALELPDGSSLDLNLNAPIPGAFGGISVCHERIEALIGIVNGIVETNISHFLLVPKSFISALSKQLSEIEAQFASMQTAIDQVKSDGGYRDVGEDLIIHSVNQQSHPNADLKSYYVAADNQVDQALNSAHRILAIISPKSFDAFSKALGGIRALEDALHKSRTDIANLRRDSKTKATQISKQAVLANAKLEELNSKTEEALGLISSSQTSANSGVDQVETDKNRIGELLGNIEELKKQSDALKGHIDAFQPAFDDFQKKLGARNESFELGKVEFEKLRARMASQSEENDKYINQSKNALGWSTASSLASSFSSSASELEMPLLLSRWMFYFSIFMLFISAAIAFNGIPYLREYIVVPPFPALNSEVNGALVSSLFSVLSIKLAVLIPAVLLVGFTSRRHRALFLQHQLYIYKKTVASALPGFKDHAADHQQAMAAAAFARLLFNPQEDSSRDLIRETGGHGWLSRWLESLISKSLKNAMAASKQKAE